MPSVTTRTLLHIFAVVGYASLGACNRPAEGNAASADARRETASASAAEIAARTSPPKLAKRWKDMEPRDWIRHVTQHTVTFSMGESSVSPTRQCSDGKESDKCQLRITPISNVSEVAIARLHINGEIIALIENIGDLDEVALGIPSKGLAYWVAYTEQNGTSGSILLDPTRKGAVFGSRLPFKRCVGSAHEGDNKPREKALFTWCDHAHPTDPVAASRLNLHTSPPWISCVDGCCSADASS